MEKHTTMGYARLALTLFISFFVMYFVMFINMDKASHYHGSITRLYMAFLMISPMAILMIVMMRKMYPDQRKNMAVIIGAIVVFVAALAGLRTQTPIGDLQYMKAMIPHHSSAIMTSKNARLQDPEVIDLSRKIIRSQEDEIAQMERILARMQ